MEVIDKESITSFKDLGVYQSSFLTFTLAKVSWLLYEYSIPY